MKVTIDINDNKAPAFLYFINSLDFIRIHKKDEYAESNKNKQAILKSIKQGLKEVELIEQGKLEPTSFDDLLNDL